MTAVATVEKRMPVRASVRWQVMGWVVLSTALIMLAMIMTTRSVFIGRIALSANAAIVQEIGEFRTFAREGRDPQTARPFTSLEALMNRYLLRQTPDSGEAFIAVVPEGVLHLNNAPAQAGTALAQDAVRLQLLLDASATSGIEQTPHGEMRWGKTEVRTDDGQSGIFIVTQFTDSQRDGVAQETLVYFGVALGGLLLIAALAWMVSGQVLAPIRQIHAAVQRVNGRGASPRMPVQGQGELAELARGLNAMLDRVDQAHAMQQHFIEQVQRHMAQAGQRARQHLARLSAPDVSAAAQAVEHRALLSLLNGIDLSLSDLDLIVRATQPGFLQCQPATLGTLTDAVLGQARSLGQPGTHGADGPRYWRLAGRAQGCAVLDAPRVLDAMRHLLDNAMIYSRAGDTLSLTSETDEEDGVPVLRLHVSSPGQPLSAEQVRAMFTFGGLSAAPEHDEGTVMGVGLAVVRAVAEAHGGYAWVEAGALQGNCFGITLPLDGPCDQACALAEAAHACVSAPVSASASAH